MTRQALAFWPEVLMWMNDFSQSPEKEFTSKLVKGFTCCLVRFRQKDINGCVRIMVHCNSNRAYRRLRSKKGRQCFTVYLMSVSTKDGVHWFELDLVPNNDKKDSCNEKLTIHPDPEKLKGYIADVLDIGHSEFKLVHTIAETAQ
jgi:hypothetical protein